MAGRNWEQERYELLKAIERSKRNYDALFSEMYSRMIAETFGQEPGDAGLARAVEAIDARLRQAKDALYRHTEEHLRSLGL